MSSNHSKNNHVPFASTDNDVSKRSSHRPAVHRRYDLDQISNFWGMSSTMRDARQRRVRARMFAADAPPTPGAAVEYRLPTSARPELPQGRPGLPARCRSRASHMRPPRHTHQTRIATRARPSRERPKRLRWCTTHPTYPTHGGARSGAVSSGWSECAAGPEVLRRAFTADEADAVGREYARRGARARSKSSSNADRRAPEAPRVWVAEGPPNVRSNIAQTPSSDA